MILKNSKQHFITSWNVQQNKTLFLSIIKEYNITSKKSKSFIFYDRIGNVG